MTCILKNIIDLSCIPFNYIAWRLYTNLPYVASLYSSELILPFVASDHIHSSRIHPENRQRGEIYSFYFRRINIKILHNTRICCKRKKATKILIKYKLISTNLRQSLLKFTLNSHQLNARFFITHF